MTHQIGAAERAALLWLARVAVERAVALAAGAEVAHHPVFDRRAGAFVTLHVSGALRGCVGQPEAVRRLGDVVPSCAAAAACEDPRFAPLRAIELAALSIEISVLSRLHVLTDPDAIVIGRHGLTVEHAGRRGLLLPQVAASRGWSPAEFLEHTCLKAGLPRDAWRRGGVIRVFEADVFGEELARDPSSL